MTRMQKSWANLTIHANVPKIHKEIEIEIFIFKICFQRCSDSSLVNKKHGTKMKLIFIYQL